MNSEEISIISTNPFIQRFVLAIIQSIRIKNLSHEEKHTIHTDMVPKTSKRIIRIPTKEKMLPSVEVTSVKTPIIKKHIHELAPLTRTPVIRQVQAPRVIKPYIARTTQVKTIQEYGKITPLLEDPSVSKIECQGEGIPIMVMRTGQKQKTRIILNRQEIADILEKISDKAHVPLLGGVFRSAVEKFSINAIVSEMIGSKFIIKKHSPYALLE